MRMSARVPSQTDYAQAIAAIIATLPDERRIQVYEYALFLQLRSTLSDDTKAQIDADEAWWDAQFAATDDDRLKTFIMTAMAEGETTGITITNDSLIPAGADDNK